MPENNNRLLMIEAKIPANNTDPLSNMIQIHRTACQYLHVPEDIMIKLQFESKPVSEDGIEEYELFRLGFYVGCKAAEMERINKVIIAFPWDTNKINLSVGTTHAKLATSKETALIWSLLLAWNNRFDAIKYIGIEDFKGQDSVAEYVRKVNSVDRFVLKHRDEQNEVGVVAGIFNNKPCAIAINLHHGLVAFGTTGDDARTMAMLKANFLDNVQVVKAIKEEWPTMPLS